MGQVLAILKGAGGGGHRQFWGGLSCNRTGGGTKGFHPLKEGGGRTSFSLSSRGRVKKVSVPLFFNFVMTNP